MRPLLTPLLLPAFIPSATSFLITTATECRGNSPSSFLCLDEPHHHRGTVSVERRHRRRLALHHRHDRHLGRHNDRLSHSSHDHVPSLCQLYSMNNENFNENNMDTNFYGLTEDGDFAMIGINMEEEEAATNNENNNHQNSNSEGNNNLFDGITFSGLMEGTNAMNSASVSAAPQTENNGGYDERSGSSGAMLEGGVNPMRSFHRGSSTTSSSSSSFRGSAVGSISGDGGDTMSLSDALFGRIQLGGENNNVGNGGGSDFRTGQNAGSNNNNNVGTVIGGTTKEHTSARDENIFNDVGIHPEKKRTGSKNYTRIGGTIIGSSNNNYYNSNNNSNSNNPQQETIDEETLTSLKEWLVEIIPTLSDQDLNNYALGLHNIGFHPECITMCELQLEDLQFMKVLHRRYVFNEVTGVEHPWEA